MTISSPWRDALSEATNVGASDPKAKGRGYIEKDDCMFAVLKTGGKQYRVSPGDILVVEKLKVVLDDLLWGQLVTSKKRRRNEEAKQC